MGHFTLPPRQIITVIRVLVVKAATILAFLPALAAALTNNPSFERFSCQGGKGKLARFTE
jgi:hypothetical protein